MFNPLQIQPAPNVIVFLMAGKWRVNKNGTVTTHKTRDEAYRYATK